MEDYQNNIGGCATCEKSCKSEETLLHDLVKTVQMGVTSIDVVEDKIASDEFKQWAVSQKDTYRHYSDQVDDYMRKHGYDEEFVTKMQTMWQKGMVKMSAMMMNSDSLNCPKGIGDELLSLADEINDFMLDGIDRLRSWL